MVFRTSWWLELLRKKIREIKFWNCEKSAKHKSCAIECWFQKCFCFWKILKNFWVEAKKHAKFHLFFTPQNVGNLWSLLIITYSILRILYKQKHCRQTKIKCATFMFLRIFHNFKIWFRGFFFLKVPITKKFWIPRLMFIIINMTFQTKKSDMGKNSPWRSLWSTVGALFSKWSWVLERSGRAVTIVCVNSGDYTCNTFNS